MMEDSGVFFMIITVAFYIVGLAFMLSYQSTKYKFREIIRRIEYIENLNEASYKKEQGCSKINPCEYCMRMKNIKEERLKFLEDRFYNKERK